MGALALPVFTYGLCITPPLCIGNKPPRIFFRPTGPRCGSLGRSPAQPDVGLGMLLQQGPGLKGRASFVARPDGA